MDTNREKELLDRLAALEQRVEQAEKKAERADDYRQIMNVMAGHSFCYNAHEQQYEIDRFWTKEKEDCWYNGSTTPIGVETYYVNNTKRLRALQRDIVSRVYHKALTEKDKVGYRVMNMLTTPFIEIAGDGQTAQALWFVFNVLCHVDENGVPQPTVNAGKQCAEFTKENGVWKLWRFRGCPGGFDLDVGLTNTGLTPSDTKMTFGTPKPTEEELRLMHQRRLVNEPKSFDDYGYSPWTPASNDPPLPEPYETWADAKPFFIFEDEQ